MSDLLVILLVALSAINLIILVVLLAGSSNGRLTKLETRLEGLDKGLEKVDRTLKDEMLSNREEFNLNARMGREEANSSIKAFNSSVVTQMAEISALQRSQLDIFSNQLKSLTESNEQKLDRMRTVMEQSLRQLQEDNNNKLEQMRATVDEKLHNTLEQRLGESFKLVSERLELVHKGLGEMQSLASGVGDLKRVLTNVKTRGTWGELQLENILEQIMSTEQYDKNVITKKGSNDRVEFAVKLPGKSIDGSDYIWLPIDAKFPQEDYQRLQDAQEQANMQLAEEAAKSLELKIKSFAKDIRQKYIDPPHTTDFGIMFLPTEGLYAEVLRRPGLCECLQNEYRIITAGPTTLIALLNSLQMGFRTLAIEKRSSEVWALLGAVKTEFWKFGEILDKTQKKLQEASDTIETAARKSRTIGRKLKNVQELSNDEAAIMLDSAEESEQD